MSEEKILAFVVTTVFTEHNPEIFRVVGQALLRKEAACRGRCHASMPWDGQDRCQIVVKIEGNPKVTSEIHPLQIFEVSRPRCDFLAQVARESACRD